MTGRAAAVAILAALALAAAYLSLSFRIGKDESEQFHAKMDAIVADAEREALLKRVAALEASDQVNQQRIAALEGEQGEEATTRK